MPQGMVYSKKNEFSSLLSLKNYFFPLSVQDSVPPLEAKDRMNKLRAERTEDEHKDENLAVKVGIQNVRANKLEKEKEEDRMKARDAMERVRAGKTKKKKWKVKKTTKTKPK